jgi:DNA-binding response OmpR family regulator
MDTPKRFLLVEDDRRLGRLIREYLQEHETYVVSLEERGDRAVDRIIREQPDLVILDIMLPGLDGLSVCRQVRSRYHGPILMLTAREDDMDQVAGLEIGADDYVRKPIEPRVLLARLRALLRRASASASARDVTAQVKQVITLGQLHIHPGSRQVTLAGESIDLTSSEFELLCLLAQQANEVVDRSVLFNHLKGIPYDGIDRSVDIMVSRLRKKLGDHAKPPQRIKTIWSRGYLLVGNAWDGPPAGERR